MKIIVAHPGKQHSYKLASALKKAGLLQYYVTEVYDKKGDWWYKIFKCFLNRNNKKRVNAHTNLDLDDSQVVQYCHFGGLLQSFALRINKSKRLYRLLYDFYTPRFGKHVARLAIESGADMVICYDASSYKCFEYLQNKAPDIIRVMDVSIIARPFMKKIYEEDINKSGDVSLRQENYHLWQKGKVEIFQKEIDLTQYFVVASDFVKKSLLFSGVREEKILKIPYGANVNSDAKKVFNTNADAPLHLLFVGQVIARKGVRMLLEVFSELDTDKYQLTMVGAYNPHSSYIIHYKKRANVKFIGFVTHDRMRRIYESADIFILPSIAEGMALVGIEAMACGLPVICTYNTGLSDVVENGKNGFLLPYGDKNELQSKIKWCADHRETIFMMGENARQTAKEYTWERYERNVVNKINSIV